MRVAELIDVDCAVWKADLISLLFEEAGTQAIHNIPISVRLPPGLLFWWPTKNGVFSVSSCYWLGILGERGWTGSRQVQPGNQIWNLIWGLDTLPKLKHFCWRACTKGLAVLERLKYRLIVLPSCAQFD